MLGFYVAVDSTEEQPSAKGFYYVLNAFEPFPWEDKEEGVLRRVWGFNEVSGWDNGTPPQYWLKQLTDPLLVKGDEMTTAPRLYTLPDIINECHRQIDKFGDQSNRDLFQWQSILNEEVGEVAKAINDTFFIKPNGDSLEVRLKQRESMIELRKELVQVAAVSISMLNAVDVQTDALEEIIIYHENASKDKGQEP